MKKKLFLPCILLLLLLSGCDLRNRRPSTDFIPATHAPRETSDIVATTESIPEDSSPAKELTRHSVRTIVSDNTTYTDIYGKEWTYEFRLPFVDYPTTAASDCNIEIDRIFRRTIDEQVRLSEQGQPLTVLKVDYECYYTGTLISLNVWLEKTNSTFERTVYCFRSDGTLASNADILEAVWIDSDEFLTKLRELLQERYVSENVDDTNYVTYNLYYDKTLDQARTLDDFSLYATAEDVVFAKVTIYDAHGVATAIELEVSP